jgi:hypothetical protein
MMQSAVALAASQRGEAKRLPGGGSGGDALERDREAVPSRGR